jgi:hypothetical protein
MFIATGPGIPPGRTPGRPALRGVSAVLGDLLGVATDWPDTGVAPWSRALAAAENAVAAEGTKSDASPVRVTR